MGRKYIIETGFQAITAVQDLLEIVCPADAIMVVHSVQIQQSTEETSADAEKLQLLYKRGIGATSGSGGGSVTPIKIETGDAAAGITAERNGTTQATAGGGSLATIKSDVFDVLSGYEFTPTPEIRLIFSPSEMFVLSVEAPTDSVTVNAHVVVEEIGG